MKGLLDFASTPEGQGLLSAVAGGMAGARRGAPVNSIGRGLLAGLQGYGNAQQLQQQEAESALNRQVRDLQIKSAQQQMQEKEEQRKAFEGFNPQLMATQGALAGGGGPTLANASKLQPVDPLKQQLFELAKAGGMSWADYLKMSTPKAPDFKVVGNSLLKVTDTGVTEAYRAPEQVKRTAIEEMMDAAGITDPATRQSFILQGLRKQTTHAPAASTNVTLRQETEEAKKVGGFFGEEYGNIQKAGVQGQSKLNRYSRLGELLQGVQTGKFTETGLEVAKAARTLGFNVGENVGNMEAAQALSGEIALELRNPSGGAGMPGAMSDADRQFLVNMVPGLATTPEGRMLMLDTARRLATRDMEVARIAREYRKRNGSIDEGFYGELARFSEKNPLFQQAPATSKPAENGFSIRRVR